MFFCTACSTLSQLNPMKEQAQSYLNLYSSKLAASLGCFVNIKPVETVYISLAKGIVERPFSCVLVLITYINFHFL